MSDKEIVLDRVDTDLKIVFPGGGFLLIQQRVENGIVDVWFDDNKKVYLHHGVDLDEAKVIHERDNTVYMAQQLIIMGLLSDE